ncbi:hypothetical protein FRC11_007345 [Ceratobasidium sp. 423]|nr:hypothetical protein FRC11_007345 [Ceratobasidium sp. 423]
MPRAQSERGHKPTTGRISLFRTDVSPPGPFALSYYRTILLPPSLDQRPAVGPLASIRIDTTDMTDATLTPAQTAQKMFELALAKNRQRADIVFFKAFIAGVFLSFGGLLHVIVSGGSAGLTSANPGLVKILGGLVFPIGLVMIVLQGQELLTSNMMTEPMLLVKRAAPWWSLPANWILVLFGNLTGSLFFAGVLVKASGVISAEPYPTYVRSFVLHKAMDPHWHQIFLRGIANMFFIPLGIMMGAKMTVADYIKKSLIASFLGNVVGALLVALPFMYFFNPQYDRAPRDEEERGSSSGSSSLVERVLSKRIDPSTRKE